MVAIKSISFSGSGSYSPFFFGICQYLFKKYDVSKVIWFVTSGACVPVIISIAGLSYDEGLIYLLKTCNMFLNKRLFNIELKSYCLLLYNMLPANIHDMIRNKVYINVTKFPEMSKKIYTNFQSKKEVILYILASSNIPGIFNTDIIINNSKYIDGLFSGNIIVLNKDTIKIAVNNMFASSNNLFHYINPDIVYVNDSIFTTFYNMFYPFNIKDSTKLIDSGYLTAKKNKQIFLNIGLKKR